MSNGGKGSAPRPYSVDQQTFSDNWERIFGRPPTDDERRAVKEKVAELSASIERDLVAAFMAEQSAKSHRNPDEQAP